ncbi:hypothetical protein AXG93_4024s1010 [Marchantia polymorpha subsp. ruderalis]|uniref:Uncharacterized protein n=1 Tax=Marchantia polymorpha subsp. ruderalis TaxID=1480154 RepID=A0A176WR09_MARPO|nr:hypothetical protein AXG93_4024s1010 [Marchantia polymorpha subsp. ruderalis]
MTPESDSYAKLMMEIKDEAKRYEGEFKLALPPDQDVVDITNSCGGLLSQRASSSTSLENSGISIQMRCMCKELGVQKVYAANFLIDRSVKLRKVVRRFYHRGLKEVKYPLIPRLLFRGQVLEVWKPNY